MILPAKQIDVSTFVFGEPTSSSVACSRDYQDKKLHALAGWGAISAPATASLRFLDFANNRDTPEASEAFSFLVLPIAIDVVRMVVNVATPLATNTVTFTLRKNGVDTAAQKVLPALTTQISLTQPISFAAGDLVSIAVQQSSTQTAAAWGCLVSLAYSSAETS